MLGQVIFEAWTALRRNRVRSFLTMLGIVWGIATVTLLIAYGNSFRSILVNGFDAFGKSAVICWPQQTSEQPGGQRAGKKVVTGAGRLDMVKADAPLVKHACLETVKRPGIALWRSHGRNGGNSRRLSGIWRDAQRGAVGGPMDQSVRRTRTPPRVFLSVAACASNYSAGGRRLARRCRSAACASPSSA